MLTRSNPLGRKARRSSATAAPAAGAARDLAERGVDWVQGRVIGVADGRPVLDDGRVVEVAPVVWCTGFRQAFGWVDVPAFGEDGWPASTAGSSTTSPGCSSAAPASSTPPRR